MNKILYWTPRILTIAFILFLGLFALDVFDGNESLMKKSVEFLIHLIPNFVLILILIVTWKHEWVGTIAFILAGIAYIVMFWGRFPVATYLTISGPLFLIGILFWMNWTNRKKLSPKKESNAMTGE
jgi:formate hydrogenlyase subunit 3/multisubunit Na+/H+ antiporter MnhD subunit